MSISIIGSAGRNNEYYDRETYNRMIDHAKIIINQIIRSNQWDEKEVEIVSGGAALSDHVAVSLFLEGTINKIKLCLPCHFNQSRYVETNSIGKNSNRYHDFFHRKTGINSLCEIQTAIDQGAKTEVYSGFFDRNNKVAKSQYVLAFSLEDGNYSIWVPGEKSSIKSRPTKGGTKYTWNKANQSIRIFCPIS